jgi:hypothetical protein
MVTARNPYQLVERNLRHAMAFYAGSPPRGEVRQMPGVTAIHCGWNYPVFNSALLSTPVPGLEGDLSSRVALASIYFRALGVGWSYWMCHDLLNEPSLRQMRETCYTYGLEPVLTAPGMYAPELRPPRFDPAPLDVREVTGAAGRIAFAHLVATIFELPFQMTMHMYATAEDWAPEYSAFIGYAGEKPVTISMVNVSDGCCGFYSVGTVAGHRRRGYAETVMRAAHAVMRGRFSCNSCVLQSSTVGRRLYEQMGFREVTRFSVYRAAPG